MNGHRYDVRGVPYLYDHRLNPNTTPAREIVVASVKLAKSLTKNSYRPEKPAGVPRMSFDPAEKSEQMELPA